MAIGDTTTGFEYIIGNGGPDPVAALLATNLHTLALESGDSELSGDADTETEYYFNGVSINVAADTGLTGFSVGARYYVDTETANPDPPGGTILVRTYPDWTLVSATFTVELEGASTDRNPFYTSTKTESLFVPTSGTYGTATAGIIDGSQYVYSKVFNQSQFNYIPRLSPSSQEIVNPTNGVFPSTPNDPANNVYPIDTITAFSPDPRRQILFTYSYQLTYNAGSEINATTGITIEQYVSQPITDYGPTLKALLDNSYYGKGLYGLDQWPVEEPALYQKDGTAITPIPRPDVLIEDSSTSSGYAEYNQNTNGEGFPLRLDTEPTAVIEPPEFDTTTVIPGVEIPGVDYTYDTYDNDVIDAFS